MTDKLVRPLLVVLVLGVLYLAWAVHDLRQTVLQTRTVVTSQPAMVQDLNPPLLQIQKNQVSITRGLAYLELLTEGLARRAGLPVAQARAAFEAQPGGVPPGWTWNEVWEGDAAPAPGGSR